MFRKLSARSSPKPKQIPPTTSNFSSRPKSQTLIICSAALPNVAAAKSTPSAAPIHRNTQPASHGDHHYLQADLLPPEIVISILDGFVKALLVENKRFEQLKSQCLQGAKLGHDDDHLSAIPSGSILKSSHTVLTYLIWGIRHIEKALAEKENKEQHLEKADQMLRSLIDSMQEEVDDHLTAVLASARVPNAGFILGLAHVFLALVQKMRKSSSKLVVSHLLKAFMVSPRDARQSFIPEIWSQLFRPHLAAVEAWYKKEHTSIIRNSSISSSISANSNPWSPSSTSAKASPMSTSTVVSRANSLMDLVAGIRAGKKSTSSTSDENNNVQSEQDQNKHLAKMNMQVNLLSNLYEQSLDEGTVQYARHYQDVITSYYDRFSFDQASKTQPAPQKNDVHSEMHSAMINMSSFHNNQEQVQSGIQGAAAPEVGGLVEDDEADSKVVSGGGWMGTNALQLRRSLYDAIFGTFPMEKTSKKSTNSSSIPSSQVVNLLRFCNKELPEVLDPLRPKVEMDKNACTYVVIDGPTAGSQPAASKPATIRDMVNAALSPEVQEESKSNSRTSVLIHSPMTKIIDDDSFLMPDQESSTILTSGAAESTKLSPAYQTDDDRQSVTKEASAVKKLHHSKRLIDYIKDPDHKSETCSSPSSHVAEKAGNQLSRTGQRKMSLTIECTKMEEQRYRMMKRSNSESSAPVKGHDRGRPTSEDQGSKRRASSNVNPSKGIRSSRSELPLAKCSATKPNMVNKKKVEEATDVQVKYCTSLQVHQTRLSTINNAKGRIKASSDKDNARSQALSPPESELQKGAGVYAGEACNQLKEVANELREVVQATRLCGNTPEGVRRCEEVLLKLSQGWLKCKSATLLQQKGSAHKEADSAGSTGVAALEGLTEELLFILATSELQEAQRLALCLLSSSASSKRTYLDEMPTSQRCDPSRAKGERCEEPTGSQLSSNPNVWQALSHLLQQQGRLPEAALLLHLLNPAQYSASCHHFLPHLLPILLDLAQRNIPYTARNDFHHMGDHCDNPFHSRLCLFGDSLKPRALALMMMSRLLAVVDGVTRLQACKHVLFPNVNALPCLLHSLDCAQSLDERAAAAFILTTCMQADNICRQHIVTHVKLTTVVTLLQQSASNTCAFQTSVNFVTELLRTRKANIAKMLGCIRHDGLLNCMHALMAYLQTASLENQPPAAGLLLQLDLLLGDEQRYSVFREEALEALLAPLLSERNKEASFIAARVLSTIGQSHSEQELEAWLLKKAGLGTGSHKSSNKSSPPQSTSTTATPSALASKENEEEEEEEESAVVVEWDERVARAIIRQGGGMLVSGALANGLRSSMAEVRKACLLVAAWLTSHLSKMHHLDQTQQYKVCKVVGATAKERMREALQAQLQEIAAVNSGSAIVERVFAALALQNLAK